MNNISYNASGSNFERIFIGLISVTAGLILIYLAIMGPLIKGEIRYRTPEVINNQLLGQDLVNLAVLAPLLVIGGLLLWFKKKAAIYLLTATPLFLIYYALSYTIGWEWNGPKYPGNNERYFFYFLLILIAALLIMLYSLSVFPKKVLGRFRKVPLALYSFLFVFFLLIFAGMWIKEVLEVIKFGTTRAYDISPVAFWLVRVFDLGLSIPLGLISIYLIWTRAEKAYPLIFLLYGFFFTQILAVNAMGWMMFLRRDPAFSPSNLVVFTALALLIAYGLLYLNKNYGWPEE
ncbi:MAG: hypothetical protein ACUVRL_02375 [Candidatus Saccharicenans sp.]|uniref:hypothetical protein n=1 Tax=Candidatus Saccharicenans sp. TaxID=2819258 RepID=UPI00404B7999